MGVFAIISGKMIDELKDQFHAELFSEYLYLSMAVWLNAPDQSGFAHFFKARAAEERMHAMKFYDYIYEGAAELF